MSFMVQQMMFNLFDELHGSANDVQPYWKQGRWINKEVLYERKNIL